MILLLQVQRVVRSSVSRAVAGVRRVVCWRRWTGVGRVKFSKGLRASPILTILSPKKGIATKDARGRPAWFVWFGVFSLKPHHVKTAYIQASGKPAANKRHPAQKSATNRPISRRLFENLSVGHRSASKKCFRDKSQLKLRLRCMCAHSDSVEIMRVAAQVWLRPQRHVTFHVGKGRS